MRYVLVNPLAYGLPDRTWYGTRWSERTSSPTVELCKTTRTVLAPVPPGCCGDTILHHAAVRSQAQSRNWPPTWADSAGSRHRGGYLGRGQGAPHGGTGQGAGRAQGAALGSTWPRGTGHRAGQQVGGMHGIGTGGVGHRVGSGGTGGVAVGRRRPWGMGRWHGVAWVVVGVAGLPQGGTPPPGSTGSGCNAPPRICTGFQVDEPSEAALERPCAWLCAPLA